MTDAELAIADLDAALAADGEWIVLRRVVGSGVAQQTIDVRCRAFVRALKPEELAGAVNLTVYSVILPPTQIIDAQWPGESVPLNPQEDRRVPRATQDRVIFVDRDAKERAISAVMPVYAGGQLVRINLLVS